MKKQLMLFTMLFCAWCRGEKRPPNFVFIVVDDQHRGKCNFFPEGLNAKGQTTTLSPNVDRLVSEGVLLAGMHSCSPVCCPTRYSCLTGTYPSRARNEVMLSTLKSYGQTHIRQNAEILADDATLPKALKQLGYVTGAVGKNHVIACDDWVHIDFRKKVSEPGVQDQLNKNRDALRAAFHAAGFDFAERLYNTNANANGPGELSNHNMEWVTEGAFEFLDRYAKGDKPFFLYFATTLPHTPLNGYKGNPLSTPDGFLEKIPEVMPPRSTIEERLAAAGVSPKKGDMLWLDDGVGALENKLRENGVLENTVIIYYNDHGVESGKASLYEGGMLSFAIVKGPANLVQSGLKTDALCSSVDIPYTILKMAGGDSSLMKQDAVDLSPVLNGTASEVRKYVYGELGATRSIITKGWKYLAFREPKALTDMSIEAKKTILEKYSAYRETVGSTPWKADPSKPFPHMSFIPGGDEVEQKVMGEYPNYFDKDQLYHLSSDPREQTNLAVLPENKMRLKEMQAELVAVLNNLPGAFGELKRSE